MGFIFYISFKPLIIREIFFNQDIDVSESDNDADQHQKQGEDVSRPELAVQICSDDEASENREHHGKTDAARISHLYPKAFIVFIHRRRALYHKAKSMSIFFWAPKKQEIAVQLHIFFKKNIEGFGYVIELRASQVLVASDVESIFAHEIRLRQASPVFGSQLRKCGLLRGNAVE